MQLPGHQFPGSSVYFANHTALPPPPQSMITFSLLVIEHPLSDDEQQQFKLFCLVHEKERRLCPCSPLGCPSDVAYIPECIRSHPYTGDGGFLEAASMTVCPVFGYFPTVCHGPHRRNCRRRGRPRSSRRGWRVQLYWRIKTFTCRANRKPLSLDTARSSCY